MKRFYFNSDLFVLPGDGGLGCLQSLLYGLPAVCVSADLLENQADICVYDPIVSMEQIIKDLKYLHDLDPVKYSYLTDEVIEKKVKVEDNPYNAFDKTFAITILTE